MKHPSRFTLVFISVIIVYITSYVLYVTVFPKPPFEIDLPSYAAELLQYENPSLYSRDPIYQDGFVTGLYWSSSYAYMRLFQGLHNITQHNISAIMALLQLIPAFTLFLTFYWLLRAFPLDRWLCLMFALGISLWLILSRLEGIPTAYYYACVPVFLRLLWQFLVEPSLHDKPVVLWQVVLIGMIIGVSSMLINSVNGLAFNALTLCLVTTQFLARRMKWQVYAALLLGLIPFLGLAALRGAGGGTNSVQGAEAAQYLMSFLPMSSVVVSFQSSFVAQGTVEIFGVNNSWLFYVPLFAMVVGLSVWIRYVPQPTRIIKLIYVSLSAALWLWTLGNIGIVLYLYFLHRFWHRQETLYDYVFMTGMSLGVFIGPILLWITIAVWNVIQWHSLVFIMLMMFRFHLLTYFIAGVALVFMVQHLTDRVGNLSTRCLIQFIFIVAIVSQPVNLPPVLSVELLILLTLMLIFMSLTASKKMYFTRPLFAIRRVRTMVVFGIVAVSTFAAMVLLTFWATWGSGGDSSVPLDLNLLLSMNQQMVASENRIRTDYMDMTQWLRVNTSLDSLIHMNYGPVDRYGFFRYLTQRSMFYTVLDNLLGQFNPNLAADHRDLYRETNTPLLLFGRVFARYDINYFVTYPRTLLPLPVWNQDGWSVLTHVYSNTTYDIYRVEKLSTQELKAMYLSKFERYIAERFLLEK